jgi:hypothetical protein
VRSPEGVGTEEVEESPEEIENREENHQSHLEISTAPPGDFVEDGGLGEGRPHGRGGLKGEGVVGSGAEGEDERDEQRTVAPDERDDEHEESDRRDDEIRGSHIGEEGERGADIHLASLVKAEGGGLDNRRDKRRGGLTNPEGMK